jgi:hypothetical protein
MGTKVRAYGADIAVLIGRYADDGTAPDAYRRMLISSTSLSAEQALSYDPIIGSGTNEAQDPSYDAVTDTGDLVVPIDVRGVGAVLAGVFGLPDTTDNKASGKITFAAQPAAASTITLGGVAWTFVAGASGASETTIGGTLAATLTALADDLNASLNATISGCTYTAAAAELLIERDVAGVVGNTFALAASAGSNGKPDAVTLRGGGYKHVFISGADDVPEHVIEVGHVKLAVPKYYRHERAKFGGLKFQMATSGRAKMTVPVIAVDEADFADTIEPAPDDAFDFVGFSNSGGFIEREGMRLGDVVGGNFEYANGLEAVRSIRDDQKIDGADTGEHTSKGGVTVRFGGDAAESLAAKAKAQAPTTIRYGFSHPAGWRLDFALSRVFLPRPKKEIRGPGGIEQDYAWQASGAAGTMLTVTLINDVADYAA